eukprot:CAMPEP_0177663050 /NCGR_PEP_ID=MMETSP0447-20121125/19703_1 /TAXON_ID=0 /ORGANISM="Stygamoeba regulata, Strain BSH-02190019" /LENGTH=358 /DNA_ID=CAMNT_0019168829 /DNA_START=179 /DNA_END=1253 /DNA_ORIENTATION=+
MATKPSTAAPDGTGAKFSKLSEMKSVTSSKAKQELRLYAVTFNCDSQCPMVPENERQELGLGMPDERCSITGEGLGAMLPASVLGEAGKPAKCDLVAVALQEVDVISITKAAKTKGASWGEKASSALAVAWTALTVLKNNVAFPQDQSARNLQYWFHALRTHLAPHYTPLVSHRYGTSALFVFCTPAVAPSFHVFTAREEFQKDNSLVPPEELEGAYVASSGRYWSAVKSCTGVALRYGTDSTILLCSAHMPAGTNSVDAPGFESNAVELAQLCVQDAAVCERLEFFQDVYTHLDMGSADVAVFCADTNFRAAVLQDAAVCERLEFFQDVYTHLDMGSADVAVFCADTNFRAAVCAGR